jgi:hypothetical protein
MAVDGTPYWLEGIEEVCSGCDVNYAYAVEARCVACDSALCPLCTVTIHLEIFCSECSGNEDEE